MNPTKQQYAEYLKSEHWQELKGRVRKRKTCPGCTLHKPLQCHHMLYRGDPHETKKGDLMWLCASCHKLFHELFGLMAPEEKRKNRCDLKAFTKYQLREELWNRGLWPYPNKPRLGPRRTLSRLKKQAAAKGV
jgi:hypothetical protein